jgi:hypothetical protein
MTNFIQIGDTYVDLDKVVKVNIFETVSDDLTYTTVQINDLDYFITRTPINEVKKLFGLEVKDEG